MKRKNSQQSKINFPVKKQKIEEDEEWEEKRESISKVRSKYQRAKQTTKDKKVPKKRTNTKETKKRVQKKIPEKKVSKTKTKKKESSSEDEEYKERSILSVTERLSNIMHNERRHQKFVKKLKPTSADDEIDIKNEEEKETNFYKTGKGVTFTPLEKQFMEIRKQHPDLVLFYELGYRYFFMGKDADISSKVLGLSSFWKGNFLTACIPVGRLFVHVRRFIQAGYKVGIVSQTETASLKTNKGKLFTRALTAIYSKATFIGQEIDPVGSIGNTENEEVPNPEFIMGQYLMCIYEECITKNGENVDISIIAVQTSTGDIIYDQFEDSFLRKELDTRLHHINPIEILLPKDITSQTEKIIQNFNPNKRKEDKVSIEHYEPSKERSIFDLIKKIFYKKNTEEDDEEILRGKEKALSIIESFTTNLTKSMMGILKYLEKYRLESLFFLDCNYRHFTTTQYMKLDANSLRNLEVFSNPSSGLYGKGTLFWTINKTSTAMGKRLLIEWLKKPLLDSQKIRDRLDAVEELSQTNDDAIANFFATLTSIPDLERGICRVYYRKCSPTEFLAILKAFKSIIDALPDESSVTSPLLIDIFGTMPDIQSDIKYFYESMDQNALERGVVDPVLLFKDGFFPELSKAKKKKAKSEEKLQSFLKEIRKVLGDSSQKYISVAKNEYLIEVKNANVKRVPNSWIPCGSTKSVKRFQPPDVESELLVLNRSRDELAIASKDSWNKFLELFTGKYPKFRDFVGRLAMLDCLKSASILAQHNGYIKPTISDEEQIVIEEGRHPVIEILTEQCMPNSVSLKMENGILHKCMILTGPNMGGKTSYTRQIALITILAQIGCFVPASSVTLSPVDGIFTRMGGYDDEIAGQSTFLVEILETSHLLSLTTSRSLIILDELGRGTSTHDGVAIAYATLDYLVSNLKPWTFFVTHYPALAQLEYKYPGQITSHHMGYVTDPDDDKNVIFLYQLKDGIEKRSYGLNVAQLANIPSEILDRAKYLSQLLERDVTARQYQYYFKLLVGILHNGSRNIVQLSDLQKNIKLVMNT